MTWKMEWLKSLLQNGIKKKQQKKKKKKGQPKDPWDNLKHTNICIIGVSEGEERERERTQESI